jgi:hypothetical protein
MGRYDILYQIRHLNPETQHHQILRLLGSYEFPWLAQKSLEFALFRTYAVPSISKLLAQTGQFEKHGQRRYDDTGLIVAEIGEHGYDSERGRAALRRMNHLHGRFQIANEDYLYVLSTFIYEPIRWITRYGYRPLTDNERLAHYYFWREVGKRMNIRDIPPTYEAFEQYNVAYEREHFRYAESNFIVGEATIQVFLHWYAPPLRPLVRESIYAILDDQLREAFGFPRANSALRGMIDMGLKGLALSIRYLAPPRREPWHFTQQRSRTYPFGYTIERLGPTDVPRDRVVKSEAPSSE